MGLAEDEAFYRRNESAIRERYGGKWVLIRDCIVRGSYDTEEEAFHNARRTQKPFLVVQVKGRRADDPHGR